MDFKIVKAIFLGFCCVVGLLIFWYAIDVFLIAFAASLLAIFLNAIGRGTQKITHLPYPLALIVGVICILGILTLTFWLYTPLLTDQFSRLIDQLPQAVDTLRNNITPFLGNNFLSGDTLQKEFSLSNEKIFSRLITVFSVTIGSIGSFVIFLIVSLYMALTPDRYVQWVLIFCPEKKRKRFLKLLEKIGQTLRWWILGKCLSMIVIGILTFVSLKLLNVSLAFILGLLAALLAFIPYVGAIIAAIPAILIAFTQSPLLAFYVLLVCLGIHLVDGYFITPHIEQRTVALPPALTILAQVLLFLLIGPIGLALATPLVVVCTAMMHNSRQTHP